MKSHARVVVIGGGIMGAGLLYHLAKEGWTDVMLVEKGELTSGSTWHAAAFIPHFIGNPAMAKIHSYASKIYKELEAETGQATGFHDCGTIRLGATQDEHDWYCRVRSMLRSQGTECHIIGPEEISKLHPLLDLEGEKFGIYTPGDGHTDPAGSTHALAIGARAMGAEISLRNRVVDIKQKSDLTWEVITENGTIIAEHVVNAAGSFAPQIGAMIGAKVPVVSIPHHYLVTESLDEVIALDKETPTIRDPRASCYYREEQQGLIIGPYEMEGAETWGVDGIPWSFDTELLPENMDVIMPCLEAAAKRIPAFASAGIKQVVCGAITHVPDLGILIGPAAGFRNFWLCCGSSVGLTQGPGAGKYLAQWMVHGQAEIDINELDARRFGDWAVGSYTNQRSLEGYHQMFQVHLPGDNMGAGRPVNTTPIYDKLKAQGAQFAENFGWEVPKWFAPKGVSERSGYRRSNWFDSVAAECRAVRERVGVMDKTSMSKFDVSGTDSTKFLERVLADHLPQANGDIVVARALTKQGGIECEFTVTRIDDDHYYLLSPTMSQLRSLDWLTHCAEDFENVTITNVTHEFGVLAIAGPRSREVLTKLTDEDLGNSAFPWLNAREVDVAGMQVRALRTSDVGELGWELHLAMSQLEALYDALTDAGAEFEMTSFGLYAANSLRMEKAYKSWGYELTATKTAVESGHAQTKRSDCRFIGSEALKRSAANSLIYLEVEAEDADVFGIEQVFANGRAVGLTTSGAFGHTVGKSLAFAYVEPGSATSDTELEVEILGRRCRARILDDAVYDPQNSRLHG